MSDDSLQITTATAAHRVQALWLIYAAMPAEDRAAQIAATVAGAKDPDEPFADLCIARRGNRLVAAAWLQPMPGRAANIWPPQLIDGEPESTATALFNELESRLSAADLDLAQAIQFSAEGVVADRLRRHGYRVAARLLYLICEVTGGDDAAGNGCQAPASRAGSSPLHFAAFAPSQARRLAELIERTYVQTQDIPALNDVRDLGDVLEGYREAGVHDPGNWFFVRQHGRDVGCLLLADHPGLDQVELVYMGVVPEARGQGLGKRLAAYAKRHARRLGRGRLILGVDSENGPALLSYTATGFHALQQRWVFLRSLRRPETTRFSA